MTTSKKKDSVWSWKMSDEDLKNQVENYNTLKITESYRGISVITALALLALSFVLAGFGAVTLDSGMFIEWAIYLVALFFVYKGHRWAIITVMILWTGDKAVQIFNIVSGGQGSAISIFFWWLVLIPYLYKALRVENERKKLVHA